MPVFALTPDMGQAVVHHLSSLAPLPQEGYLAGQSVSSALFDLFVPGGDGMAVYNDLDVFYQLTEEDEQVVKRSRRTLQTVEYHDVDVHEEYGHLNLEVTHAYNIVRSHRCGLVNLIAFDNLSWGRRSSMLESLLQGFDLNCTQVGVSLRTGQLEWTPAFAEFVNTRQLEISNVQTPHHTAMRWFKKRRELPGAYGRDQDAMELVSLLSYAKGTRGQARMVELDHLRWRFGKKNAALYEEYRAQLEGYFELRTDGESFFRLEPKQQPDQQMINLARAYPTRAVAQVFNDIRAPRKATLKARMYPVLCKGPRGSDRRVTLSLGSYLTQGTRYLKGNVDLRQLDDTDTFAAEHRMLVPYLWRLSADSQIAERFAWAALERRHGRWIYGYVEVQIRRHGKDRLSADGWADELDRLAIEEQDPDTLLANHPRFEANLADYRVRELVTRGELLAEGEDLHHCVGGYALEVREGRSRILRIRHPDKRRWSTLELVRYEHGDTPNAKWVVAQHLSFCNEPPHAETDALTEAILMELACEEHAACADELQCGPDAVATAGALSTVGGSGEAIGSPAKAEEAPSSAPGRQPRAIAIILEAAADGLRSRLAHVVRNLLRTVAIWPCHKPDSASLTFPTMRGPSRGLARFRHTAPQGPTRLMYIPDREPVRSGLNDTDK